MTAAILSASQMTKWPTALLTGVREEAACCMQCVAGSSDAHKKMCMFVCAAVIKLAMQTHVFYENRLFGMDLGGTVSVLPDQLQHPISVPVSIPVPSSQFQFQFPALVPVSFSV